MHTTVKKIIAVVLSITVIGGVFVVLSGRDVKDFHDKYKDTDLTVDVQGMERVGTYNKYLAQYKDAGKPSTDIDIQLDDCEMNKAVFSVVGTDIQLADNWNFKLEGYYRYYYSRLYMISTYDNGKTGEIFKNDGIGYSYGFDLMLQKNVGKWFDGYISYSFINAKFKNPTEPEYANQVTIRGEPLNEWWTLKRLDLS